MENQEKNGDDNDEYETFSDKFQAFLDQERYGSRNDLQNFEPQEIMDQQNDCHRVSLHDEGIMEMIPNCDDYG